MRPGVLFVGNFLSKRGLNRSYIEDLSDRIEARGWPVLRTSNRLPRVARMLDMLRSVWEWRAQYAVAQVDVFSGPSFAWAEAVCVALRALGKPYVLTLHGGNLPLFARSWPRRTRRLLQSAARVTTPSGYLEAEMRRYRADLVVQPNAVDVARYRFRPRETPSPTMVWVRALHALYNPVLAVEVLARVRARFPDARLTMLGPDKDGSRAHVGARAAELGVTEHLEIVGGVSPARVPEYLAAADIFLNTTNADNTPLSLLEAMSAGSCIVSTSVGGIPYLVDDEREALLVPPREPAAMSAAVVRALETPGLALRLSTAAFERARRHDWACVLDSWETMLTEVAHA
jgi:glycosyltransferase involved in cell wall biosynthesis